MTNTVESLPQPAPVEPAPPELPVTTIEARRGWRLVDLGELWRYRELVMFLTWRDVKVRYKQTALGAAWAVIQPLATMLVFTLFLGRVAGSGADNAVAYPLFVFAGLLPWTLFANSITSAGLSVVGSQNLVTKVYFPRLIIPMSAVGVGLVDFAVAFGVLGVLMAVYGTAPGWSLLLTPAIVLGLVVAALGVGTLLSALTVAYRDFRYVVPFGVQLWMFSTPSIYLQGGWEPGTWGYLLLPLNPAYGLIAAFRQAVLDQPIDFYTLGVSSAVAAVLLVAGCWYFRRVERSFADII